MTKISKQNAGGINYLMVGCAINGTCAASAASFIKAVTLTDTDIVDDGMTLVVQFTNETSAGTAPEHITLYSSDQVNYYLDPQLTQAYALAPAGCYQIEYTGTANAYDYISYPMLQVGSKKYAICNQHGSYAGGRLWDAGDTVCFLCVGEKMFTTLIVDESGALEGKVDKTTTVNGHPLSENVVVTKADVGLGNVVNTGDSATPVSGGTTKFTTGGAFTELAKKVDKTTTVNGYSLCTNVTISKDDVGLGSVVNTGDSATPVQNGTTKFTTGGAYTELNKKIDKTEKGVANGVATLDNSGRVPYSQLPESAMEYEGKWDASTNTPTLKDGTGVNGEFYIVSVGGTVNFGTTASPRTETFAVDDRVIYDGSSDQWDKLPAGNVRSVNGETGDVQLDAADIPYNANTTTKSAIDSKVAQTTTVNGHALSSNVTVSKSDVGLGNVANTGDSATPVSGGTTKFTTGGAYTELNKKVDKETGKGLSSNDFTNALKTKLDGIEAGAQVNTITGVKGSSETDYRTGNVNITKSNIGLGNVANTGDSATPVQNGTTKFTTGGAYTELAKKVDKTTTVNGHALSGNVTVSKDDVGLGSVVNTGDSATPVEGGATKFTTGGAFTELAKKVDKEDGKILSTNDFTNADKTKLNGIAAGAEVNVQSDWTQTCNACDSYIKNKPTLATVATSGKYCDLSGLPTIPAAQVQADWVQSCDACIDYIKNKPTLATVATSGKYCDLSGTPTLATVATSGKYCDLSGRPSLATVATSGKYCDLSGLPTIPAAQIQSDWTQTTTTCKDYIKNKPTLATVATSGKYCDLSGKPTLGTAAACDVGCFRAADWTPTCVECAGMAAYTECLCRRPVSDNRAYPIPMTGGCTSVVDAYYYVDSDGKLTYNPSTNVLAVPTVSLCNGIGCASRNIRGYNSKSYTADTRCTTFDVKCWMKCVAVCHAIGANETLEIDYTWASASNNTICWGSVSSVPLEGATVRVSTNSYGANIWNDSCSGWHRIRYDIYPSGGGSYSFYATKGSNTAVAATFCCDINTVRKASTASSATNATCFGGCTFAQACTTIRSGLTDCVGTVTNIDIYCDTTCLCNINSSGAICLGTNAFMSCTFGTAAACAATAFLPAGQVITIGTGCATQSAGVICGKGNKSTNALICFLNTTNDTYGNGVSIGGGGTVIIGAGESAATVWCGINNSANLYGTAAGTETLYLASDGAINIFTNVNGGYACRKTVTIDADGYVNATCFCGCATDSAKLGGTAASSYLKTTGCAADSAKLTGKLPSALCVACAGANGSGTAFGSAAVCDAGCFRSSTWTPTCVACAGANGSGTAFGTAATVNTGNAAGCIPLIGTALGTTNNNKIIVADANGKLKSSGCTIGSAASKTAGSAKGNVPLINASAGLGSTNNNIVVTDTSGNLKASGTVVGSAAGKTAGSAAGNVPLVGTALGTTADKIVLTDASGQLKPSSSVVGSAAYCAATAFRASTWTPTCVACADNSTCFNGCTYQQMKDDISVSYHAAGIFCSVTDGTITGCACWRRDLCTGYWSVQVLPGHGGTGGSWVVDCVFYNAVRCATCDFKGINTCGAACEGVMGQIRWLTNINFIAANTMSYSGCSDVGFGNYNQGAVYRAKCGCTCGMIRDGTLVAGFSAVQ